MMKVKNWKERILFVVDLWCDIILISKGCCFKIIGRWWLQPESVGLAPVLELSVNLAFFPSSVVGIRKSIYYTNNIG